ncbi:MAG: hypothetical protein WKF84_14375 [Pyrinomonadaceae bacterium]
MGKKMSELEREQWAVVGERGCEETGLSYESAIRLIERLKAQDVRGLAVITQAAAQRLIQLADSSKENSAIIGR